MTEISIRRVHDGVPPGWHPILVDRLWPRGVRMWLRSLGGGVFAALRGGLVAAITQDWLQVGVAV